MNLKNAVVLITGANRGIGLAFAKEALARGARKVHAAARDPSKVTLAGVEAVRLDVTKPEEVAALARQCGDVTVLINNAGTAEVGGLLAPGGEESFRNQLETNFFGILRTVREFGPILGNNGGGAIVNVLSVASFRNTPVLSTYGATKTAAWALTNGIRNDLRGQGTQVLAVHAGPVDTDLTASFNIPKSAPKLVADKTFDALEAREKKVLVDDVSIQVKSGLTAPSPVYLNS